MSVNRQTGVDSVHAFGQIACTPGTVSGERQITKNTTL